MIDEPVILETSTEMRDLARLIKRSIGILVGYWTLNKMPVSHPYRQVANMLEGYLERRYKV